MLKLLAFFTQAGAGSRKISLLLYLSLGPLLISPLKAQQPDSLALNPRKLKVLGYSGAAAYGSLLAGLHFLWYAEQPQSRFHFFDDNRQWMQVDKAGHAYSAYQLGRTATEAFLWTGMPSGKAVLYGTISGWLFMLPVEILDGFSPEYGASWGDLAANTSGSLLFGGQMLLWKEVRIKPKFSFLPTPFAPLRPNMLGHHLPTQLLKDYNGQTYWLSVDIDKFLPSGNKLVPWINLSLGYGTQEMIYARPEENETLGFKPYAQFYIGPELDLSHLKSRKKWVNILLFLLEGIRLPAPALEISKNKMRLHPVYF